MTEDETISQKAGHQEYRPEDDDTFVYQPRCIYCGREHYVLGVIPISKGQAGCHNCGKVPPVFHNEADYRTALDEWRRYREEERH